MTGVMVECSNLLRSLCMYWQESEAGEWETVYPGMQVDASRWDAWRELTFPFLQELTARESGLPFVKFTMDVHCFSRRETDLLRIRKMTDDTRRLLAGQAIVVRDFDLSELPAIGMARLREAEVRDFTRVEQLVAGRPLFHTLVSVRGTAQV